MIEPIARNKSLVIIAGQRPRNRKYRTRRYYAERRLRLQPTVPTDRPWEALEAVVRARPFGFRHARFELLTLDDNKLTIIFDTSQPEVTK